MRHSDSNSNVTYTPKYLNVEETCGDTRASYYLDNADQRPQPVHTRKRKPFHVAFRSLFLPEV